jgi:hypothetical protein
VAEIVDHLTASDDDDEVWTSLCGVRETDLPPAPLCPRCEEIERRSPRWTWRMPGTQLKAKPTPVSFYRAYGLYLLVSAALFGLCWLIGLPTWCVWMVTGAMLTLWFGVFSSRVDDIRKTLTRR